jgi:intracellular multiplication protein IcmP
MPRGAGPEPQQGGADNSLEFLWVIVALIIGVMLTWYYGKSYITEGIIFVRFYEIIAIKFVLDMWVEFVPWAATHLHLSLPIPDFTLLNIWQNFALTHKGAAPFSILLEFSNNIGSYVRYLTIIILLGFVAYFYFGSSIQRFKNIYNMKQLKLLEQENWPQIAPVVKLDLVNTDLDTGPWAIASSPIKFCKRNNLITEERDIYGRYTITLMRGAAYRAFALQLGPRWQGPDFLPMYLQALYAIFVLRINGDKKSADKLVEQLAASAALGKIDFSGVDAIIAKNKNTRPVLKIVVCHAYVTTAMASLLNISREAGVLATSEFIWLKPIDRRMWFMLNSVGRPTAVSEISGAFAHWLAEKKLGIPLVVPMVDEAVNGLESALKDILYKPDED